MSDTELRDATSQMLEEAYTKGELTNIKSSIDALVAGGMDLTSAMKQVYQGLNFVFKINTLRYGLKFGKILVHILLEN